VSPVSIWVRGARPRTLGASVTPVVVGTAAADEVVPWRFVAALLVGLGLQIGVNYANDYHDGVRGVDTAERIGPSRLVSSGLASARSVLLAALACVFVAGVAGLALALATTLWLVPLGATAMLALWLYSGGPRPYAELGLGELMVFLYFGVLATAGTAFVHAESVPAAAWWSSAAVGFLAVAILVANNLRDIETDAAAGRRTLAVRLGDRRTRALYRACVVAAFLVVALGAIAEAIDEAIDEGIGITSWALLAFGALPVANRQILAIAGAQGRALIGVLVGTASLQVVFGILLAAGLWIGRT
jgi:1,4-dihydroxy-2-naphthoate polyprenyltransferase